MIQSIKDAIRYKDLERINNFLEVRSLQRCTTNQTAIDVGLSEEFGSV
jgi:hypothetical protein